MTLEIILVRIDIFTKEGYYWWTKRTRKVIYSPKEAR